MQFGEQKRLTNLLKNPLTPVKRIYLKLHAGLLVPIPADRGNHSLAKGGRGDAITQ